MIAWLTTKKTIKIDFVPFRKKRYENRLKS